MAKTENTEMDRRLARLSENCPVCRHARKKQRGLLFLLVKSFEKYCPNCRAYEKVHGHKSHEPVPEPD